MGVLSSLGPVLRELREGRADLIDIASRSKAMGFKRSESALSKFERGEVVPRNLDQLISVYAEELEISFSELWRLAAERANGDPLEELDDDPPSNEGAESGNVGTGHAKPTAPAAEEGAG